jgi:hypothetical protein
MGWCWIVEYGVPPSGGAFLSDGRPSAESHYLPIPSFVAIESEGLPRFESQMKAFKDVRSLHHLNPVKLLLIAGA